MASPQSTETMKQQRGTQMQAVSQVASNTLWRMAKDGHAAECAMASTPVGVEAQFLIDGRMLASYQFGTHAQVVTWAVEKCADLGMRGWTIQARQSQRYLAA
jgi:hypothetical protein